MKILIGNTGLVGTTLKEKIKFDYEFNSKNITSFNEIVKDGCELYLSCLPATKWLVNQKITEDFENMNNILSIISEKQYSKIILISTIDVYCDSPLKSNEDYNPNISKLNYGNNRYLFELFVREILKTDDLKIFRLPALFSGKIKKNVLYDLINNHNIESINLNSAYQWYNLDNLVYDIQNFTETHPNETVINLFTEPIFTVELLKLFPHINHLNLKYGEPVVYDYTTKHGNYISNKELVLTDIKKLISHVSDK
jgi:hypothetical protein